MFSFLKIFGKTKKNGMRKSIRKGKSLRKTRSNKSNKKVKNIKKGGMIPFI